MDPSINSELSSPPSPSSFHYDDSYLESLSQPTTPQSSQRGVKRKRPNDSEKMFVCPQCPKTFSHDGYLRMHLKTHDENRRRFVCPECERRFTQMVYLEFHIRMHTERSLDAMPRPKRSNIAEPLISQESQDEPKTPNIEEFAIFQEQRHQQFYKYEIPKTRDHFVLPVDDSSCGSIGSYEDICRDESSSSNLSSTTGYSEFAAEDLNHQRDDQPLQLYHFRDEQSRLHDEIARIVVNEETKDFATMIIHFSAF